ncbi:hypothetical protein HA402_014704 [Bradysia odoriphaga]|nr:hypothetical protein HA402_014704 [Bradysia odoriphaga]
MNRQLLSKFCLYNQSFRKFSYKPIKRPSLSQLKDPQDKSSNGHCLKVPTLHECLVAKIKAVGPLPVAEYMKEALTNPNGGYYMNKDVFGQKGDFVTSPEIGQIFGELVAVWLYSEWQKIGSPKPFQIIELGPGRGTLIQDVIRSLSQFGLSECFSVHLVEVSPHLSQLQARRLCCQYRNNEPNADERHYCRGETLSGIPILWYKKVEDVPNHFSIVLAHEFFDALPIHKFQKTDGKWREILVDYDAKAEKYQLVVARTETPMLKLFLANLDSKEQREHIEYSVLGHQILEHLNLRLEEHGGFGLVMDYGHNGDKGDTFRGFKEHQLHDPLIEPGTADLTADVDFKQVKQMVEKDDRLITFGPVEQRVFLKKLGGDVRLDRLLKSAVPNVRSQIQSGYDMLTDPKEMGSRFKFFSIFPSVLTDHLRKYPAYGFD